MALLQDEDVQFLKESFAELKQPVTLTLVRKERSRLILPGADPSDEQPDATEEIRMLLGEIAAIHPLIKVVERAPEDDELVPAIVFSSASSKGSMRYVGIPAGYEMSTLISTILDLGVGEDMVPPEVVQRLDAMANPVRLEVLVTPGWPQCPNAARVALQLAMASSKVRADVVEAQEFPELARKYQVRAVPMTILNGDGTQSIVGAVPPIQVVEAVERAGG